MAKNQMILNNNMLDLKTYAQKNSFRDPKCYKC